MKEVNAPKCGRENDLIGFLYDELDDGETQSFQHHVRDCASCNAELAAFRDVREAVVTWRNESLGVISSPITELQPASVVHQKPSALAAVRAFFSLAPLWTKGAVAFASALFVLFAVLVITRWNTGQSLESTPPPVVIHQTPSSDSPEQITALVEQRVQEELRRIKSSAEKASPAAVVVAGANPGPRRRVLNYSAQSATNQKLRRPLSKTEREQLASDLRLISDKTDNELDLLGDRINQ